MNEDILDLLRLRMQAISIGHLAIRYTLRWDEVPPIKVYFGEDQVIEGQATAFTNPAIESGVIHCRALLEFMGLVAKGSEHLTQRQGARKDDVVIENFSGINGPLNKIEVVDALKPYKGEVKEAEMALAYMIHAANKVLAHSTHGFSKSGEASRLIEIAFRGVPTLMINYFYNPMGLGAPDYEIKGRRRDA